MTTFPAFLEHLVKNCPKHNRRWLGEVPCPECVGRKDLKLDAAQIGAALAADRYVLSANSSVGKRNASRRTVYGLQALIESYPYPRTYLAKVTGISWKTTYDHANRKHRADPEQVKRYAAAFGVSETEVYGR